ncbi:MAG: arabinofuranosyltransferase [Candidatus Zixiibacteriota bacterium]|nr:MAG: arabinofuranosyltransferase [candidate division Zixibacteria bacterium]
MTDKNPAARRNLIALIYTFIFVVIGLYFAFSGGGHYNYESQAKLNDWIQLRIWIILSLFMGIIIYYSTLRRNAKLWSWILTLSFYFVIFYALLYKGTDYGLNGHWGDNGNRLALVTKFREFSSIFQDWYFKGLPSFYPPLWLFLSGKLAWLFGVEGYKTIKLGYFVIYALYPPALFLVWSKIAPKRIAFAVAFLTVFFRDIHLDYVYYEHITAAFFIPWWLYFVEDIKCKKSKGFKWYFLGAFLGALIFLTYYYWFLIGLMSIVVRALVRLVVGEKTYLKTPSIKHKTVLLSGVGLLSTIYWLPLLLSILRYGADSMQNKWFNPVYLNANVPFFEFSLISLVLLAALIYLGARFRHKINSNFGVLLLSMVALLLIERGLNLNEISIQTRKLRELLPVFLGVPSGYCFVLLYGIINRRFTRWRGVLLLVTAVSIFYLAGNHATITGHSMYKIAVNSRVPANDIAVFESIDCRGKVFLTNRYLEAVYLPYFMFVCPNGATAHTAARYHQRITFLRYLGKLEDPARVAFLLKRNCFNEVDYFYLPGDDTRDVAYYDMYPLYFPGRNIKLRLEFPFATTIQSKYFTGRHARGIYEVQLPDESVVDIFGTKERPADLAAALKEYNHLRLCAGFLQGAYRDSLKPFLDDVASMVEDSVDLASLCEFDRKLALADFQVAADASGLHRLRVIFLAEKRVLKDYRIFIHAYPEDTALLDPGDRRKRFKNLGFAPDPATSQWIAGEYRFFERDIELKAGKYKFHLGFFDKDEIRLPGTYWSGYLLIDSGGFKK